MMMNQFLNLVATAATDMTKTERPWTPAFPNSLGNPGMAFQMTSTLPSVLMALVKRKTNFFISKSMIFRLLLSYIIGISLHEIMRRFICLVVLLYSYTLTGLKIFQFSKIYHKVEGTLAC